MSHYTVTVVVKAETEADASYAVEEALDPFSEHFEVAPYEVDIEEIEIERALAWTDQQRTEAGKPVLDREDAEAVTMAVADWVGCDVVNRREDGSLFYASTFNPDGHWDWWVIGGRWADRFLRKDGTRGDLVRVRDVDLAAMREEAEKAAGEEYDGFVQATAGMEIAPRWAEVKERYGTDIDAARREFNSHPWVKAATRWFDDPHDMWCVEAENPREAFIARAVASMGVPYAWLQDGDWSQQGYIGMFMSLAAEEPDQVAQWHAEVAARWESLDGDLWVANVDCHT